MYFIQYIKYWSQLQAPERVICSNKVQSHLVPAYRAYIIGPNVRNMYCIQYI